MREIKFRAWDEGIKRMFGPWDISHFPARFKMKCLEQFTGLQDKNGKEIYEGDIVELSAQWGGFQGLVIFEYGCFGVKDGNSVYTFQDIDSESLEIIGNIHENPELLEGE